MDLTSTKGAAEESAEYALRSSYGRLLSVLASADGDIVGAEDALADAFERALTTWPRSGVPSNPDAWLLTTARNRRRDVWKSASHRRNVPLDPAHENFAHIDTIDPDALPDKRLELLLVCAHPAVDRALHTPLMLDVVLGYTAKEIARAFALPSSTLAARLGRAKKRIREARLPFEVPDRTDLPERIGAVRSAVYGAFAIDWHSTGTEIREALSGEALHLAETVCALLPDDAEAHGLAALICLSSARLPARCADGMLVPLREQDVDLWDDGLMARGEAHLLSAHTLFASGSSALGRFQLEAAVQAVHCARRHTGGTDWESASRLHRVLQNVAPTKGGAVALSVVTAEIEGPESGLQMLDRIDDAGGFQPFWAARAHLLEQIGRLDDARAAYSKAQSLTPDEPSRRYLAAKAARLP